METLRTELTSPRGRVLGLLAVVAIVLLFPLPRASRAIHAVYDLGHAPLFGVLAVLLFWWGRARLPRNDLLAAAIVWGFAAALGCAAEYAQGFLGRHTSWQDAVSNMLGAAAFLLWAVSASWKYRLLRLAAVAVGIACLVTAWIGPARNLADAIVQYRDMPLMGSFEHRLEFSRWVWPPQNSQIGQSLNWASEGKYSMAIEFRPAKFPSVSLYWPVENWSAYRTLSFDVLLTGEEPLPIVVKIEDADDNGETSDRYNGLILLKPGLNSPQIRLADVAIAPDGRTLDLRRIKRLQLFTVDLNQPRLLFLDNLRLNP